MLLNLTENQKAIIRRIAKDINYASLEPLFNQIIIQSMGNNIPQERVIGWRDALIDMFKDSLKEKDN